MIGNLLSIRESWHRCNFKIFHHVRNSPNRKPKSEHFFESMNIENADDARCTCHRIQSIQILFSPAYKTGFIKKIEITKLVLERNKGEGILHAGPDLEFF
jgi:hypothetical protein